MSLSSQTRSKASSTRPSISSSSQDSSSISSFSYPDDLPDLKPLPQGHAPLACVDPALAVPFDMSILTISHKRDQTSIKAVIVGGGIAGLAIAIMMELAGMEFEILERSTGDEPSMGCSIAVGPPVLRLMEQLDLLPQIEQASKVITGLTIVDGEGKRMGRVDGVDEDRYGYPLRVMTREAMCQILLSKVSKKHLHRGKLVVETLQNSNGVSCKCSDGSTYYGDIIIGADGVHSLTRERMYLQLKEQRRLPDVDMEPSCYEHLAVGGISAPLDKNVYPTAHDDTAEVHIVYTKDAPYTFWYLPVADNKVAWGITSCPDPKYKYHSYSHLHYNPAVQDSQKSLTFSASGVTRPAGSRARASSRMREHSQSQIHDDWMVPSRIDIEANFKDLLDKRCAMGTTTIRDFVAQTPKKAISMVDREERLYKTWHHGRIVLIGDACHHHLAIGGQGAVQSLLDGVCLVNLLYEMEYNTPSEIAKAFKKYQSKRSGIAKASIDESTLTEKIFHGQGFMAGIMRKFMFNTVWSFNMRNDKFNNNRPQLSFLPFVEDRGASKANRQKASARLSGNMAFAI
ncbi:hypothetical protein EDD21DRAFT_231033 [Dissophora ornata]|nr:hypothetical protein BGZ58_002287 [Dissophora ornata]KAI8604222.1 hypothetical protein EDD21DRAFT_231033 [Dissophora ornata]